MHADRINKQSNFFFPKRPKRLHPLPAKELKNNQFPHASPVITIWCKSNIFIIVRDSATAS